MTASLLKVSNYLHQPPAAVKAVLLDRAQPHKVIYYC
jgi:hypothetical protein